MYEPEGDVQATSLATGVRFGLSVGDLDQLHGLDHLLRSGSRS
jgi:hypothetical protein